MTGSGVQSPVGRGVPEFWEALLAGRTGVRAIERFRADDLTPNVAAEVPWDDGDADRAGAFALQAADEALRDAGLDLATVAPARLGIALGTTLGGMTIFERWDAAGTPVDGIEQVPYYAPAVRLARHAGARGPVATPQLACASGTHAVALAASWIRAGHADVVLAGGTDLLCRFVVAGVNCLRATRDAARPFDRRRKGLVLGEGAAVVVLESEAHARARGARVRAFVSGVGAAADAIHMTAPDREGAGAARAIRAALDDAGVAPADVAFVSAHGTGTPYNDAMEAAALTRVFGAGRVPGELDQGRHWPHPRRRGRSEAVVCASSRRGSCPDGRPRGRRSGVRVARPWCTAPCAASTPGRRVRRRPGSRARERGARARAVHDDRRRVSGFGRARAEPRELRPTGARTRAAPPSA
jgi:3-oxoacyl-(acyl-carrier-protein) synthase